MKSLLDVNLYLKYFHFTCCLLGQNIKESIWIFSAFPNAEKSVVCTEFPMCSKLRSSQWKTHFSQFFFISFIMLSLKLPILFLTANFKLGHNFRLYFQVFLNSQRDFGIFECCSIWTSQFFPIHGKMGKWFFLNISLDIH